MNHVDKYYWIINHPKIGCETSQGSVELTPHMVNPSNGVIENDLTLNTKSEWWVEFSKLDKKGDKYKTHYWSLDCGGDSAEEAINNLYKLVLDKYGKYEDPYEINYNSEESK